MNGSNEGTYLNCTFSSNTAYEGTGLYLHSGGANGPYSGSVIGCGFEGCDKGLRVGNSADTNPGVNAWSFTGCKFTTCDDGVSVEYANQITFIGCRFEDNRQNGFATLGTTGTKAAALLILNGYFEGNIVRNIDLSATSGECAIIGCVFSGGKSRDLSATGAGNAWYGTYNDDTGAINAGYAFLMAGQTAAYVDGTVYLKTLAFLGTAPTGSLTTNLGGASPASVAAPYQWMSCKAPDGTPCVFPIWRL